MKNSLGPKGCESPCVEGDETLTTTLRVCLFQFSRSNSLSKNRNLKQRDTRA